MELANNNDEKSISEDATKRCLIGFSRFVGFYWTTFGDFACARAKCSEYYARVNVIYLAN